LGNLVSGLATSAERINILWGFLDFRRALHGAGFTQGFQWVDGSFTEDVEVIEGRSPRDIDVITFVYLPDMAIVQQVVNACPSLLDPRVTKTHFHVDAYFVTLDGVQLNFLVEQTTYWYGLLSHRRDDRWKGYLRIELTPNEDSSARTTLMGMRPAGVHP